VAGEGQLLNELKEKISENQFEERFELLGFRKDAAELLKSSHCVLVPSLWEGMPLVVLEAGAAETPMLVTPVGSIPSILNTDNAFIGSLSDWPKMLSDLYADYATGQQKAKKLSRLVENRYSIRASAEKHLSLYSAIAASKLN
jgi:glycosyltransferase involved in cell wall biosynthesis